MSTPGTAAPGSGALELPEAIVWSAIGEIWPAKAVIAISKALLVVNVRNGATCSRLDVPLVISSM